MRVLWISVNTTSLDPKVANVIEWSAALQVDGSVGRRLHDRICPVLHPQDQHWGGTPDQFLAAYNGSTNDPMYRLKVCDEGPFFYNESTLGHLGWEVPSELLDAQKTPVMALRRLVEALGGEGRKWLVAGHNSAFVAELLQAWSRRVDKVLARELEALVDFAKPIDTIPFFRVVAAFQPPVAAKGFGLKSVAAYFGRDVTWGTESKLDGLLSVCGSVISGGAVNEKAAHSNLPS